MTTQELIEARKREIKSAIRGYDQTLKLNGKMSLNSVLSYIDNSIIPDYNDMSDYISSLHNKVTTILRLANTTAMRKNKRAYQWLQSSRNVQEVWASIRMYALLGDEVFTVTEDAMQYMYDNFLSKELEDCTEENIYELYAIYICDYLLLHNSYGAEAKHINLRVGDMLYSALIPTKEATLKEGKSEIQLAVAVGDNDTSTATYNYSIELIVEDGYINVDSEALDVLCCNKECPYYKKSNSQEDKDGYKRVDCHTSECQRCNAFGKEVISPINLLKAVATVIYSYENNKKTTRVINEGEKVEYEPIPLPMCDTPVVIYTDSLNDKETIVRVIKRDANYIPGTHASPREHTRAAHMRFNPRTGQKDIPVRGCTVNKGYVKTTYEVRAHKRKKVEAEPDTTLKGQQMLDDLLSKV